MKSGLALSDWTTFAVEAEYEAFGAVRLVKIHNELRHYVEKHEQELKNAKAGK